MEIKPALRYQSVVSTAFMIFYKGCVDFINNSFYLEAHIKSPTAQNYTIKTKNTKWHNITVPMNELNSDSWLGILTVFALVLLCLG